MTEMPPKPTKKQQFFTYVKVILGLCLLVAFYYYLVSPFVGICTGRPSVLLIQNTEDQEITCKNDSFCLFFDSTPIPPKTTAIRKFYPGVNRKMTFSLRNAQNKPIKTIAAPVISGHAIFVWSDHNPFISQAIQPKEIKDPTLQQQFKDLVTQQSLSADSYKNQIVPFTSFLIPVEAKEFVFGFEFNLSLLTTEQFPKSIQKSWTKRPLLLPAEETTNLTSTQNPVE